MIADRRSIDIRTLQRSVLRDDHFNDDGKTVCFIVERGKIGRQFLWQHRKYLGGGVYRGGIMPGMIVKRGLLLDERIHIGNGDKNLCGPSGDGFGNRKLVQIVRSIVVYGAPDKVLEITRRLFSSCCRPADTVELGACLEREFRSEEHTSELQSPDHIV